MFCFFPACAVGAGRALIYFPYLYISIMRDIIWTIIIIWVVYKLVDIFRGAGQKKSQPYQQNHSNEAGRDHSAHTRKDLKSAMQKGAEKEGEYVDYEEIK